VDSLLRVIYYYIEEYSLYISTIYIIFHHPNRSLGALKEKKKKINMTREKNWW